MKEDELINITPSSGNVFADIGIKNPEEYLAKAILARQINKIIESKKWKQKEAMEVLDIDQPRISELARGRLSGFSITRLISLLNKLNQDVEIVVKPRKSSKSKHDSGGHLTVSV
jgi:predicted XRE-type DNA-binding protein